MSGALPFMQAAQGLTGAIGAISSGNYADAMAKRQATQMEQAAAVEVTNAMSRDEAMRRQARMQQGQALAASAEAGAGLNADALRQSIYDTEMDSATIRYEGMMRSSALKDQAAMTRMEGKRAKQAGYLSAASSLLNSGSNYFAGQQRTDMAKKAGTTLAAGG